MRISPLLALLSLATPCLAAGGARIGFGFNFGYPLWTPAPSGMVIRQTVVTAPGPGYVWVAADWIFNGGNWIAVPGHWDIPPEPDANWVAGHWALENNNWAWVNGYWATPPRPVPPPPPPPPAAAPAPAPH